MLIFLHTSSTKTPKNNWTTGMDHPESSSYLLEAAPRFCPSPAGSEPCLGPGRICGTRTDLWGQDGFVGPGWIWDFCCEPALQVRCRLQAAHFICLNFHARECLWHRRQVYGERKKNVDKWPSNQLEHAINHWSANNTSRRSCERSLRCHHVSCSAKQSKQNMLGIGLWEKHLSVLIKN